MLSASRIERLIWVLIYAGLFGVAVGMAVRSGVSGLEWILIGGGSLSVAVGAVLVWVRSRMRDDGDRRL